MSSSSIQLYNFSGKISDKCVCYQILQMKDSLLLWIGLDSDPSFKELAVAMKTPYDKNPTAVKLIGELSSLKSSAMAARLSKKLNKQVFVSCNLPDGDARFQTAVEERLAEEMAAAPNYF